AVEREAAAEAEPVRLRPGGEPVRLGRVLRVHPRDAGRARQRRLQPHPRPRRHPGLDQGVPGHGPLRTRGAAAPGAAMLTPYNTNLPPDLRALKGEIEGHARSFGLDFYETIFEVVDADDLNEIAAYGGFPTRYPHWSFGMAYEELRKGYDYGLSKIYEMVINNDPCYAYLMRCNHTVDQKLVMAHVYGHCDFFKNNAYFAHT